MRTSKRSEATFLFINEASVYYERHESRIKPAQGVVVLIHGFLASVDSYRRLVPILRKKYDVVVFDLPGFGRSSKRRAKVYSFSEYAAVVHQLVIRLHLGSVTVVGHSMGGQVALKFAQRYPEDVSRVILLCSSGYLKCVKRPVRLASYLPFSAQLLKWLVHKQTIKPLLQEVVYRKSCLTVEKMQAFERSLNENVFYKSLLYLAQQREGDMATEVLQTITHPVLVIAAEQDRLIPLSTGKRLHQDLPESTFKLIRKCGHLLPEERPKEVAKAIDQFILEKRTDQSL
ncbi:alpha/beta fold hydrolase [Shouchella lonarensis]|uniref:Pimeloyl-ACP methyl ester carboxylesterase n=1 Tax=Shouchella lonarensis TaxID=1464122 RepID=A0A1G6HC06_9BACI|nr:alpha/beta hydrolase [Shouchella lonarensis]SDB91731.1 Pimeloyl-ACP methyl ester carboxylesterase [Shouchella lonarensis]